MSVQKRVFVRTLVGAAVVASLGLASSAYAQETIKVGLLATLEGTVRRRRRGRDARRELAVRERGGMVAGKKIELVKASSDAKPDVA
jgi:branched-chain amino acid transport system substrate-binding protein